MSAGELRRRLLQSSRWLLPAFVLTYTVARFVVVADQLARYDINVWAFAVLDIGTAWPYGRAMVWLLESIGRRPARTVAAIGVWSALLAVTPYAYLVGASEGMPETLVAAICLFAVASAAVGLWFTRKASATPDRVYS
jgi:peptidoglycan/LPS O-acetylase OafA/YrhL